MLLNKTFSNQKLKFQIKFSTLLSMIWYGTPFSKEEWVGGGGFQTESLAL